ncbi:nuclear transport factor 2 family protein [Myxococcaceae bacterium GXIMD 01537]
MSLTVADPFLFSMTLLSAAAPPLSPRASEARDESPEDALAGLERCWRQRDMTAYLAHFAEDADLVNRSGTWFRGKERIGEQLRWLAEHGRPELFSMKLVLESTRFVAPGVAILVQRRDEGARESLATYVLTRQGSTWKVQSISIAPVEPAAARLRVAGS